MRRCGRTTPWREPDEAAISTQRRARRGAVRARDGDGCADDAASAIREALYDDDVGRRRHRAQRPRACSARSSALDELDAALSRYRRRRRRPRLQPDLARLAQPENLIAVSRVIARGAGARGFARRAFPRGFPGHRRPRPLDLHRRQPAAMGALAEPRAGGVQPGEAGRVADCSGGPAAALSGRHTRRCDGSAEGAECNDQAEQDKGDDEMSIGMRNTNSPRRRLAAAMSLAAAWSLDLVAAPAAAGILSDAAGHGGRAFQHRRRRRPVRPQPGARAAEGDRAIGGGAEPGGRERLDRVAGGQGGQGRRLHPAARAHRLAGAAACLAAQPAATAGTTSPSSACSSATRSSAPSMPIRPTAPSATWWRRCAAIPAS